TVTFKEGSTTLGTATLSNNVATLVTSPLSTGDHIIRASFAGSASFPGSTSSPIQIHVVSSDLLIPIIGIRPYKSPSFFQVDPSVTLPEGVGVTLYPTGCHTSVPSGAFVGHYADSISGCGGLTLTGPNAAYYSIRYVSGDFEVAQASLF